MTFTLPEIKMIESEVKQELALSLYAAGKVTLIQAVYIASIEFFELQGLLKDRRIPQHYGIEDLEKDMGSIRKLRDRKP